MADNYNENDIASAQSDHDIASAQSDHDIASAQSDHNIASAQSDHDIASAQSGHDIASAQSGHDIASAQSGHDIASAQSGHDIASAQSDHDIASAQSDHNLTAVSSWDDYGVTIVTEDMNRKYSDCEDMDISKSNANNSYNNILQDSLGNEIINDDNASSGYQSNNDHRSSRPYKNDVYAKRIGDRLRSAKPKVPPKSTYIPPEFEENFSSTIEAGSNFEKYDKIEVIANGIDVPQKISTFQSSGLREIILNNLKNCNYTTPTPIQKYALPIIMNDRDMIASAQTGSGKTVSVKSCLFFLLFII
jgi:hypothetical protein